MSKLGFSTDRDIEAEEARIVAYLENELGCSNVSIHRMRRWRPIMHADVTRNGVRQRLFLKGERTWPTHPYPLDYERDMQITLSRNGVVVPEILGWVDDPKTIVMAWVEGGRDAGLIQEAMENASVMSPDRWQASLRYMELLSELHAIPVEKFAAAGAEMPTNNTQEMLGNFERFHAMSETLGITDSFIAFASGWLRRNCPTNTSGLSFLTGDCGQFLSDGPNVTCLMDFEIGHIGDPMRDLACYRGRHPIENMGDLPALFAHYAKAAGKPLDLDAMAFHTVAFLTEAYYGPLFGLHDTGPGGDWVEGQVQVAIIGRRCLEALAEVIGVTLAWPKLPAAETTLYEDLALAKLEADIARLPDHQLMQEWQRNILASLPRSLKQMGHYRFWRDSALVADVASLTGKAIASVGEAEAELLRFVQAAGPDQDEAILRLLHARLSRDCLVIAGENPAADHIALSPMEPILPR
ncbi:MAG: hypothetical protein IPP45_06930 [Sphingomonadales bacterium]|nr:hypothetical protein [Sphingomonadales bacterium]